MARRIAFGFVLLAAAAALWIHAAGAPSGRTAPEPTQASTAGAVYQCAMHPQIVSDRPGICPICRMKLQRVDLAPGAAVAEAAEATEAPTPRDGGRRIVGYRHPMRPDVTSPVPAKDEMGMAYTPIYADETGGAASAVPGHAPFVLSSERQQLIGVTRGKVERRPLEVAIRAVGNVAYDPTLYQAVVEYREALRSRAAVAHGSLAEAHAGAEAIVRGARLKLLQQGLSEAQIRELGARSGDPVDLLLPGDTSWIYVQLYEYEAPLVAPGQQMTVTTPAYPGRTFSGKVVAVDPILDPATRTVRARGRVAAAGATLRPQSFVDVEIRVPLGERLAVPREAVLDTGEHRIVFVVAGEGSFEPRAVELGRQAGGWYEVLSGLAEGDEVVTSANFLIDSESRFRSALASFRSPGATPNGAPARAR